MSLNRCRKKEKMEIKRTRVDASFDQIVGTWMMISTRVLREVLTICTPEMFNDSTASRWIYNTTKPYYENRTGIQAKNTLSQAHEKG